uniref:Uncharacterized protein n=1 Tax=Pyxicephalus adspersus TaxID=30357 RepID=A0AAV3A6R5_PYXAD|nr:TPA: hypothetical protein GDO54_013199 [Pyxicephalus adspersus]
MEITLCIPIISSSFGSYRLFPNTGAQCCNIVGKAKSQSHKQETRFLGALCTLNIGMVIRKNIICNIILDVYSWFVLCICFAALVG